MNEKQLISGLGEIARNAPSLGEALRRMEILLSERLGSAVLVLRAEAPLESAQRDGFSIADFLESRDFPFRGVYSERIESEGKSVATLLACFGTWGVPSQMLRTAARQVARLLGGLLVRKEPSPAVFTLRAESGAL